MDEQFKEILENMELARRGVEPKIRLKHVVNLARNLFIVNNDLNLTAIMALEKATPITLSWAFREGKKQVGLKYKDIAIEFFTLTDSKMSVL